MSNVEKKLKPWQPHVSQPYFLYDPADDGFSYYPSEAERDEAFEDLKRYT